MLTHLLWLTPTDTNLCFDTCFLPRKRIRRKTAAFHWGTGGEIKHITNITQAAELMFFLIMQLLKLYANEIMLVPFFLFIICLEKIYFVDGLLISIHQLLTTNKMRSEIQWNEITDKNKPIICFSFVSPLTLYTFIDLFIHLMVSERGIQRAMLSFGGVGLTLKVSEERGLWWNGPGRTVTSPLRVEGHAGLAWFACEWAHSIILVRELSHQIEKVKTSFYQPFPSETEQAINNWIQAQGKVKQNDMGLL